MALAWTLRIYDLQTRFAFACYISGEDTHLDVDLVALPAACPWQSADLQTEMLVSWDS
jgi:hypothetical protein